MIPVTSEEQWQIALQDVPAWEPPLKPTVVLVPHPDDETLGIGGLIAHQRRRGAEVSVIAVSDGEAAYPGTEHLGALRRVEQGEALRELGVAAENLVSLGLPDGAVADCEEELERLLAATIAPHSLLAAPWIFDRHPDHEACGRVAQRIARKFDLELVFYLFWTWHYEQIDGLHNLALRRFQLDDRLQSAKASALARHQSQLEHHSTPILPESLLGPARRPYEIFIAHELL